MVQKFRFCAKENSELPCKSDQQMNVLNPSNIGKGRCTPPPCVFCQSRKESSDNPYLKFSFTPSQSTFGTPSTKIMLIFFALIKNLFTNQQFYNFQISLNFCLDFGIPWKPHTNKTIQVEKCYIWSVGYQNRVKGMSGFLC